LTGSIAARKLPEPRKNSSIPQKCSPTNKTLKNNQKILPSKRIELLSVDASQLCYDHISVYETTVLTVKLRGRRIVGTLRSLINYNAQQRPSIGYNASCTLFFTLSSMALCLDRSGTKYDHFGVGREGARPVSESAASNFWTDCVP
jgi:hypothetical protein